VPEKDRGTQESSSTTFIQEKKDRMVAVEREGSTSYYPLTWGEGVESMSEALPPLRKKKEEDHAPSCPKPSATVKEDLSEKKKGPILSYLGGRGKRTKSLRFRRIERRY